MSMSVRRFIPVLALLALTLPGVASRAAADDAPKELTPNAWYMSGNLYFQQKVYDKAEESYRHAVMGDSTNAQYRSRWANALCEVGKARLSDASSMPDPAKRLEAIRSLKPLYAQADQQFDKAIELDPDKMTGEAGDNRSHYWVDMYKQAQALFKNDAYPDALEYFTLLTVLDPSDPQGLFQVGYTEDKLGKPKEGVATANEAKALAQKRIEEMGDCSQFKSRQRQAGCKDKINGFELVVRNVDSFTRARNVAIAEQAFAEYEALPADDLAGRRAALLDSEKHYQLGLEQDPSLIYARFNLGNVYFAMAKTYEGDKPDTLNTHKFYRSAYRTFDVIAGADSVTAQTKIDATFNSASAAFSAGDWKKALDTYKSYINLNCRDAEAYLQIALCYQELKQNAERAPYYMTSNALSPKAEKVNLAEIKTTLTNRFQGSDAEKALTELGDPEEVKNFRSSKETPVVLSMIWWSKGIVRHYLDGQQQGEVKFTPCGSTK